MRLRDNGREAWYLSAGLAGLRKGDLQRLTWSDVDFEQGTISVRGGKAKRIDVIPMHSQLADSLRKRLNERPALGSTRVFSETVTDRTRQRDFLKAGIAHEIVVRDSSGEVVMVGRGKTRRPKTRIETVDEDGRVIDLHALRTTLGTQLARNGVAPQIAQKIMRHSDYKTTLNHYTVLGLSDTSKAIDAIPCVGDTITTAEQSTGTDDLLVLSHDAMGNTADKHPQRYPQQLGRETAQNSARRCENSPRNRSHDKGVNPIENGPYGPSSTKRVTGVEPATFSLEASFRFCPKRI